MEAHEETKIVYEKLIEIQKQADAIIDQHSGGDDMPNCLIVSGNRYDKKVTTRLQMLHLILEKQERMETVKKPTDYKPDYQRGEEYGDEILGKIKEQSTTIAFCNGLLRVIRSPDGILYNLEGSTPQKEQIAKEQTQTEGAQQIIDNAEAIAAAGEVEFGGEPLRFKTLTIELVDSDLLAKLERWEQLWLTMDAEVLAELVEHRFGFAHKGTGTLSIEQIKDVQQYCKGSPIGTMKILVKEYLRQLTMREFVTAGIGFGIKDREPY